VRREEVVRKCEEGEKVAQNCEKEEVARNDEEGKEEAYNCEEGRGSSKR
jgi:hypothetical protein